MNALITPVLYAQNLLLITVILVAQQQLLMDRIKNLLESNPMVLSLKNTKTLKLMMITLTSMCTHISVAGSAVGS